MDSVRRKQIKKSQKKTFWQKGKQKMKVAGFVLSIIGLVLSLIPFIGAFALFLLVPAFLLALLGVIISIAGKKGKNGLGIAAIILCVIGGFIVSFQVKAAKAVGKGLTEMAESTSGQTVQVEITGFGGYELGEKLDPKEVNEKALAEGFITRPAKKKFRNFETIKLYFTPKTFVVYQISSSEAGSSEDPKVIVASLEEKYKAKMGNLFDEYRFSGNNRTIATSNEFRENFITVTDKVLLEQNRKENEQIVKSKADTNGL